VNPQASPGTFLGGLERSFSGTPPLTGKGVFAHFSGEPDRVGLVSRRLRMAITGEVPPSCWSRRADGARAIREARQRTRQRLGPCVHPWKPNGRERGAYGVAAGQLWGTAAPFGVGSNK
jgi:hypothetical protein